MRRIKTWSKPFLKHKRLFLPFPSSSFFLFLPFLLLLLPFPYSSSPFLVLSFYFSSSFLPLSLLSPLPPTISILLLLRPSCEEAEIWTRERRSRVGTQTTRSLDHPLLSSYLLPVLLFPFILPFIYPLFHFPSVNPHISFPSYFPLYCTHPSS